MRLVVDSKDNLGVVDKAASKFGPELLELCGGGGFGVGGVTDNL